jgi:toxin ParE1/3/4
MPQRVVDLHPNVVDDIQQARDWYWSRDESAARAFLAEVDSAIVMIAERPEAWPPYVHGTRRFLLRRYPFSVVYRLKLTAIQIVAVAHSKRRPGFWKNR